jgi:hypothetical protein
LQVEEAVRAKQEQWKEQKQRMERERERLGHQEWKEDEQQQWL